jgi:hypothetical protein
VKFDLRGPSMPDIGSFLGWQFRDFPFGVSATLGGTPNKLHVDDFALTAGPSDIRGVFRFDLEGKPAFDIQLRSSTLDLRILQSRLDKPAEEAAKPADAKNKNKDKSKNKDKPRLIPEWDIPKELLDSFNIDLKFKAKRLITELLDVRNVNLSGDLVDGALRINTLSAESKKGNVSGNFALLPNNGNYSLNTAITARDFLLDIDIPDAVESESRSGQNIDLQLTSKGNTLRELASSLDGYIWMRGGNWQLETKRLGLLFGDFITQVLDTINPFMKTDAYQTVVCNRFFFEAKSGILETSPALFLRTDKLNMAAAGTIDLKTERIRFSIETIPRTGIGLSASDLVNPFVLIEGSLSAPRMTMNPAGTLIEGGAAVATVGLSIVAKSLYKRWLGPRKPCSKLTAEARKIRTERDPGNVPSD